MSSVFRTALICSEAKGAVKEIKLFCLVLFEKDCSEPVEFLLTWQPDRRNLSGALDPQLHRCCTTGSCLDGRPGTEFSVDGCLQVGAGAFGATQSIIVGVSTVMN